MELSRKLARLISMTERQVQPASRLCRARSSAPVMAERLLRQYV
jgi:hypothetical protein